MFSPIILSLMIPTFFLLGWSITHLIKRYKRHKSEESRYNPTS